MVEPINAVLLNNSRRSNDNLNNEYEYASRNFSRKNLFDKSTWLADFNIREHIHNKDEITDYNQKNLWLNIWYMMKEQPWQISVTPKQLQPHFWFQDKLLSYASNTIWCELVLITHKNIIDSVCHFVPSGDEVRILEELKFQIEFKDLVKRYHFTDIVYIDNDSDVDSELRQKVVNIYNEIK